MGAPDRNESAAQAKQKQCLIVFVHMVCTHYFQALFSDKFGRLGAAKSP
jgi:hypothetical protein